MDVHLYCRKTSQHFFPFSSRLVYVAAQMSRVCSVASVMTSGLAYIKSRCIKKLLVSVCSLGAKWGLC
jgi:hypothetical protein